MSSCQPHCSTPSRSLWMAALLFSQILPTDCSSGMNRCTGEPASHLIWPLAGERWSATEGCPPTRLQRSKERETAQHSSLRLGCTSPASLISHVEIVSDHPALLGHVGLQYHQPMTFTWPSTNGCHWPISTYIPITTPPFQGCLLVHPTRASSAEYTTATKSQLSWRYSQKTELLFRYLS